MRVRTYILLLFLLAWGATAWGQVSVGESRTVSANRKKLTAGQNSSTGNTTGSNVTNPNIPNGTGGETDSVQEQTARGIVYNKEIPAEELIGGTYIFHYEPGQVWIEEVEYPTLSAAGLNYFDRLDRIDGNYYLSKGGIGLSHYNLYPALAGGLEWAFQADINEGYGKTPSSVNFFQARRPYTVLGYANSLNSEYQIKASHTQNLLPRWNMALDIDFMNPDAIYANADAKNSYLDATTNYYSSDSRYQMYAGLIWQKLRMGENGGVTDDSVFADYGLTGLAGIPVNSATNRTMFNQLTVFTHQSYNFVRQVERVVTRSRVEMRDSVNRDTVYWEDTLRVGRKRVLNGGVAALDVSWNRWKHNLADSTGIDSTLTNCLYTNLYWTNNAYPEATWHNPLKLTLGLKTQWARIDEKDSLKYTIFDIIPYVSLDKTLGKGLLSLTLEHQVGHEYLDNDRLATLQYRLPIDSVRSIEARVANQWSEADFFYLHYHASGLNWDREGLLKKTNVLKGELQYQKDDKIDLTLTANQIEGLVWLSSALTPEQGTEAFWLWQARLIYHLKLWGWLCYDMQQMLQYSSDERQLSVPLWASKNSLYTDVQLFRKALTLQVGMDIRYHTRFYADGYSPQAGAFYHQNEVKVGNYLWGDVFVNLQLKRAVIYAKAGHINSLWETHPQYFILPHYPGNKFGLYYGVIWKFFD